MIFFVGRDILVDAPQRCADWLTPDPIDGRAENYIWQRFEIQNLEQIISSGKFLSLILDV